jgi:hypothetical protein
MMMSVLPVEAPEETMRNAIGQDVPLRLVKDIDKMRDALVKDVVDRYERTSRELKELKHLVTREVEAFLQISAERYRQDLGGKKGNVTLYSYDGKYKLVRSYADCMVFDEGLAAAKELIDRCLTDWIRDSNANIRLLVEQAFRPNSAGKISTSAVLGLRRLGINDERWITAMHAISESLQVMSSKAYIRAYRKDDDGNWQPISVDFATL